MKILLLAFALMISSTSYGQLLPQTETEVSKGVNIYLEGNSGTLVSDTTGQLTGNCLEVGVQYHQNFEAAPWLRMMIQGAVLSSFAPNLVNLNRYESGGAMNPDWFYNGRNASTIGFKDAEIGLFFSHYWYLGIDNNFLFKNYFTVPMQVAQNQTVTVFSELDVQPYYIGNIKDTADPDLEADGTKRTGHIDLLSIGVSYKVQFHPSWNYSTTFSYRTSGHTSTIAGSTLPNLWVTDTIDALTYNSLLRWDNTVGYAMENGLYTWVSVRYQVNQLVPHESNTDALLLVGKTTHDVYLRVGLGYKI